tara:strand:- start:3032 stop:3448 length:417 start_codon:yes stop_codon:yes gene_type:complete
MDDMFFDDDIINMDALEKAECIFFMTPEAIRNKDRASRQERFSFYRDGGNPKSSCQERFSFYCTKRYSDISTPHFYSGVWYVLYFDSNGGCALFSRPQAAYEGDDEAENIKFELVECTSCDITFSTMHSIMDKLQEYK